MNANGTANSFAKVEGRGWFHPPNEHLTRWRMLFAKEEVRKMAITNAAIAQSNSTSRERRRKSVQDPNRSSAGKISPVPETSTTAPNHEHVTAHFPCTASASRIFQKAVELRLIQTIKEPSLHNPASTGTTACCSVLPTSSSRTRVALSHLSFA